MLTLKYQFEVRYSNLLDFNQVYRGIISPYLKVAEFSISTLVDNTEYVVLHFKDEKSLVDVRWDRIIFTLEGEREDMNSSTGALYYCFEILKKLSALPSWGKIKNVLLSKWQLHELGEGVDAVDGFKSKFLSEKNIYVGEAGYDLNDMMIVLDFGTTKKNIKVNYGPFKPEVDIKAHVLHLFPTPEGSELKEKHGILIQSIAYEESSEGNIETFKTLNKRLINLLKHFKYE